MGTVNQAAGQYFAWGQIDPLAIGHFYKIDAPASRLENEGVKGKLDLGCTYVSPMQYIGGDWVFRGDLLGASKKMLLQIKYLSAVSTPLKTYSEQDNRYFDLGTGKHAVSLGTSFPVLPKYNLNLHLGGNWYYESTGGDFSKMNGLTFDIGASILDVKIKQTSLSVEATASDINFSDYNMARLRLHSRLEAEEIKSRFDLGTSASFGKDWKESFYLCANYLYTGIRSEVVDMPVGVGYDSAKGPGFNVEFNFKVTSKPTLYYSAYPFSDLPTHNFGLKFEW